MYSRMKIGYRTVGLIAVLAALAIPHLSGMGQPTSGYVKAATDLNYVGDGHVGHLLDIYLPTEGAGPFPVILFIYGSAWTRCDKKHEGQGVAEALCPEGFAVVAINHRGTLVVVEGEDPVPSGFVFPDQIHDAKAAVRFVRANASAYCLDPDRIGVFGASSGGHLAAMLGTSGGIDAWTIGGLTADLEGTLGPHTDTSSSVQAVFEAAGTTDLLELSGCPELPSIIDHDHEDSNASRFIGGALPDHPEACALASPLTYIGVGDDEPPFAIVHGSEDREVPWCQSRDLHEALRRRCSSSTFTLLQGVGHRDLAGAPGLAEAIVAFFKRVLAPDPEPASIRFATFNASLFRGSAGDLIADLQNGDAQAAAIAEIVQRIAPDVLVIDEFDYDAGGIAAEVFRTDYLGVSQHPEVDAIEYPYVFLAPSSNGVPSGFDLNRNGVLGEAEDALGFGQFEGQYGSVVFSRYPILLGEVRTFRDFLWRDMPGAVLPTVPATGEAWYGSDVLDILPLATSHLWDVPIRCGGRVIHVLTSHATPPSFDGAEDRNGRRNHDQIRFWADYVAPGAGGYITDDWGATCALPTGAGFVIMGDQNADPEDGDSYDDAILQLLDSPLVNTSVTPASTGGAAWSALQGGANASHTGDPRFDTGDFNDGSPGNLRADYVLPSNTLDILDAGVFWPAPGDPLASLVQASDHRLVWVDVAFKDAPPAPLVGLDLEIRTSSAPVEAGDAIVWRFDVTNTGDVALRDVRVRDPFTGGKAFIGGSCAMLAPGESGSISIEVTVDQEDVDRGFVAITADAFGTTAVGDGAQDNASATVIIPQTASVRLEKTPDRAYAHYPGRIAYTFAVTNAGNVTVYNVMVDDPMLEKLLVMVMGEGLPPGATAAGDLDYRLTWGDVLAGVVTNTAFAEAVGPAGQHPLDSARASVIVRGIDPGFGRLRPAFLKWLFEIAASLFPPRDFPMVADVAWGSEVFDWRHWDDALETATTGLEFVINLLGRMMVGAGLDGSILTVGDTAFTGMTEWFKFDPWLGAVPLCACGDDIEIRFVLADTLTGDAVRDDTANLTIVRVDAGAVPEIVRWAMIPFDADLGSYGTSIGTEGLAPGTYDLHIGTSFDAVNRTIRIELVDAP